MTTPKDVPPDTNNVPLDKLSDEQREWLADKFAEWTTELPAEEEPLA